MILMYSKHFQNKKNLKRKIDVFNKKNHYEISKASVEIMPDRFFNGKEIDFPFS